VPHSIIFVFSLFAITCASKDIGKHHHELLHNDRGIPRFLKGNLGTVRIEERHLTAALESTDDSRAADDEALKAAAAETLHGILQDKLAYTVNEKIDIYPDNGQKVQRDPEGNSHIRFLEYVEGLPVQGAAMVMHLSADGTVYALNGDFVMSDKDASGSPLGNVEQTCKLDGETASNIAKQKYFERELQEDPDVYPTFRWLSEPTEAIVMGDDGLPHKTWQRLLGYQPSGNPLPQYQKDIVFASCLTGAIVAVHPQIFGALAVQTYDCQERTTNCVLISKSSDPINTGDEAVDAAHNYAIATYNYFMNHFGRDSINDNGMTLISRVHYDSNYVNAFWDGTRMTYGDGDGTSILALSRDADVVAHELTHGITQHSSGLIYR